MARHGLPIFVLPGGNLVDAEFPGSQLFFGDELLAVASYWLGYLGQGEGFGGTDEGIVGVRVDING